MADLERIVEIIFQGTDSVSGVLTSMGSNVDKFGGDLEDIGQPFADATTLVLALDAAIVGLAIAGITASSGIENEASKMTASLGLTNEEAEKFKGIAEDVYTGGFGEDLAGAFNAVTLAQQKLGDNAEVDIGKVITQALQLQETWEVDVNDSLGAASTLMNHFGLTSDEAFDFISAGFQKGLNGSGDFIDSINQYSTQFSSGRADAGQFFSVMETGFSEGMLGTDRAADLFGEFRKRIQDGSTGVAESLQSLGIDNVAFEASMASGELTAIDAFNIIQQKLSETTDESVKLNVGTGLMGTQYEDLGQKSAIAINSTKTNLSDLTGTMDSVSKASETFERDMTAAFRTVTTEFGKLEEWENAKDAIAGVFSDLAKSFGEVMSTTDFGELEVIAGEIWDKIALVFTENSLDLTTVEGMQNAVDLVSESIGSLLTVTSGIVDIFTPLVGGAIDLTKWFNSLDEGSKSLIGNILGLGTGLTALGGILSVGGTLLGGLGTLVGFINPVSAMIAGSVAIAVGLGTFVESLVDVGEEVDFSTPKIEAMAGLLEGLPESVKTELNLALETGDLDKFDELLKGVTEEEWEAKVQAEVDSAQLTPFTSSLNALPTEQEVLLMAKSDPNDFEALEVAFAAIGTDTVVEIGVKATGIEDVKESISWFDEDGKEHIVEIVAESSGVDAAKKEIEEIPTEKLLEIQLQGDIDTQLAQIETRAETVQTSMEWTARIDIAEIEAGAMIAEAAFDSMGVSVTALAGSTATMFGDLLSGWGDLSNLEQSEFFSLLEDQQESQDRLIAAQIELATAQKEAIEAQAEAKQSGEAQITIDGSSLSPTLQLLLDEILTEWQGKIVADESAALLLGL